MKFKFAVLFAVAVFCPHQLLSGKEANEEDQPPLVLILSLDGKEHALVANAEQRIPGEFRNPNVKIRSAGYRLFHRNDISFRYPQDMEFSYEHAGGDKIWGLTGDDADLNIYCMQDEPAVFIQSTVKQTVLITEKPQQNVKVKRGTKKVNGVELKTYEYSIDWGDGYSTDIYAVELPAAKENRVLMFGREFEEKKLVRECIELEALVLGSLEWNVNTE